MSLIPFTRRLYPFPTFDKGTVEHIYSDICKTVGGSYYLGGTLFGPVNGTLDWRNFSLNAGIPLTNRVGKSSYFGIAIQDQSMLGGNGSSWTINYPLPWSPSWSSSPKYPTKIVSYEAYGIPNSAASFGSTGNLTISIVRNSTIVPIRALASTTFGNASPPQMTSGAVNIPVFPGDYIQVQWAFTASVGGPAGLLGNITVMLYLTSPHVR
jgi:hypothetical protein